MCHIIGNYDKTLHETNHENQNTRPAASEEREKDRLLYICFPACQTLVGKSISRGLTVSTKTMQCTVSTVKCNNYEQSQCHDFLILTPEPCLLFVLISHLHSDHFLWGQRFPGPLPWVWSRLRWHAHPLQPLQLHQSGEWLLGVVWETKL